MTAPEVNTNRAIVLYNGAPLERIDTRALVFTDGHQENPRFFIPEYIVAGRYRVIGFLIVDNKPENRWISYTDSEWTDPVTEEEMFFRGKTNRSHFLNTDRGFKMIRYFILPPNVADFFEQDKFLGGPLIDKCCREGTLPEEFDEEPARTLHAFGSIVYSKGSEEILGSVIKASFLELTTDEQRRYTWGSNQHAYVSFHPWQDFKFVIQEGQKSIYTAINNFDDILARFDRKRVLPERDLQVTASDIPQIQAP